MTDQEKAENAIKWIQALLSGKYLQRRKILGEENLGFCCWGLGCMIVGKNYNPNSSWDEEFYNYVGFKNSKSEITPHFYNCQNLANVNDNTKAGFKRIGKYLIKHADTNFRPHVAKEIKLAFK